MIKIAQRWGTDLRISYKKGLASKLNGSFGAEFLAMRLLRAFAWGGARIG